MITSEHNQEYVESRIDPELAAKNFESIPKGDDELPFILYPNLAGNTRRSDLKKINNCHRSSGWICRSLDPTTGVRLADYVRFKADKGSPLQQCWDYEKKILKTSKYRSPVGVPSRLGFLELTQNIIELVRGRCPKAFTKDRIGNFLKRHDSTETTITPGNFWLFVIESPMIPIALAEGEKKAAALLSLGIVAISIPGVRMGYRRTRDGLALHPDLALFAQPGREITFYFDSDIKPSTCKNTEQAIANTGLLLHKENCNVSVVTIPLLDGFKGAIDDYLYKFGSNSFDELKPQTFIKWEYGIERKYLITRPPNKIVDTNKMGDIDINELPERGLLVIAGNKGTGKTELIEKLTRGEDKAILANVHRIFLGRGLSVKLNADYRNDLERVTHNKQSFYLNEAGENSDRLVACSEGLIALYSTIKSQFINSPKRKGLVIDEVDQVFISLLTSSTCNKDGNRPVILSIYEEIIKAADFIILASADVSDVEINYVLAVRNKGREPNAIEDFPVFYLKNEYISEGYNTYFIDHTEEMIKAISMEIDCGGNVWAMFDSKACSEEVYKTVFEEVASTLKQGEKLLLINSSNSDEPEQIEFIKILSKPNNTEEITQFLKQYRGVFVTQSLWTSLSVEVPHFTSVYAFLTCGISPDWDISQGLSRVRSLVNRYIYCVKRGQQIPKINGYYANQIKKNLQTRTEINNRIIYQSLLVFDPIANYNWGWDDNPNIESFCQYAAKHNRSVANLKERLEARLEFEGNTILLYEYCYADDIAELKAEMKAKRAETKAAKQERILFNTKLISDDDAKEIEQKRSKLTQDEQDKLELYHIGKFYKLDGPDGLFARLDKNPEDNEARAELEEIYRNDNGGRLREPIKRLEFLLGGEEGFNRAIADDVRSVNRQSKHGHGIFAPDLKTSTSKIYVLEKLANFSKYLDPGKTQNKESLQPLEIALGSISFTELSAILGFKIPKAIGDGSTTITWLYSQILTITFGVKLKTKRVRVAGSDNKETEISIDPTRWEWLEKVMARRSESLATVNLGELEVLHPTDYGRVYPPNNSVHIGGVDPENQTTNPQHDPTPPPPLDIEKIMDGIVDQVIVEDATGRPDIVIKQSNYSTWITRRGNPISREDIRGEVYRLPTLQDVIGWTRLAISQKNSKGAQWLFNNFSSEMDRAMELHLEELSPIYDVYDLLYS